MKSRVGIFVFYDKQGIVDRYVSFLLEDMKKNLSALFIVVNGTILPSERKKIEKYADELFVRNNNGLDAGAFKEAICTFVGWDKILKYDELVLFNDTFFGPFYSFEIVFNKMDTKNLDFWGLTESYPGPCSKKYYESGFFPKHIQSYFITIENRMLHSEEFKDYWDNLPLYSTFTDVVMNHETRFTKVFNDFGYESDVFVNSKDLSAEDYNLNINVYAAIPYELIKYRNANFIKRKNFVLQSEYYQNVSDTNNLWRALNYVKNHFNYDLTMIYENLSRLYRYNDLKNTIPMLRIIDEDSAYDSVNHDFCVVINIHNYGMIGTVYPKLASIECDIYIAACDEDLLTTYTHLESNKGTFVYAKGLGLEGEELDILANFKDELKRYKYVCYLVDSEFNEKNSYITRSISNFNDTWYNLITNNNYLNCLARLQNSEPYVGLLMPPIQSQVISINNKRKRDKSAKIINRELRENATIDDFVMNEFTSYWMNSSLLAKIDFDKLKPVLIKHKRAHFLHDYYSYICLSQRMLPITLINKNSLEHQIFVYNSLISNKQKKRNLIGVIAFSVKDVLPTSVFNRVINMFPPEFWAKILYKK